MISIVGVPPHMIQLSTDSRTGRGVFRCFDSVFIIFCSEVLDLLAFTLHLSIFGHTSSISLFVIFF